MAGSPDDAEVTEGSGLQEQVRKKTVGSLKRRQVEDEISQVK